MEWAICSIIITTISTITIITTSTNIIITRWVAGNRPLSLWLFAFLPRLLLCLILVDDDDDMIMRRCEKVMVNSIDGISVILYHTTAILTFNQVLMVYWASTLSLLPSSVKIHFLQRKWERIKSPVLYWNVKGTFGRGLSYRPTFHLWGKKPPM